MVTFSYNVYFGAKDQNVQKFSIGLCYCMLVTMAWVVPYTAPECSIATQLERKFRALQLTATYSQMQCRLSRRMTMLYFKSTKYGPAIMAAYD